MSVLINRLRDLYSNEYFESALHLNVSSYHSIQLRTTVTLDDDVFEAVQAQARASGKRLGEVLSHVARRGLRASLSTASRNGLPVFTVPPDAPVIPSDLAARLLSEESD
jgi:hypothetical protein